MQYVFSRWTALPLLLGGLVITAACIEDSDDADDEADGEIRVVHAISDVSAVDILLDGEPIQPFTGIAYGDSSELIGVDAGEVDLTVVPSGSGLDEALDLEDLDGAIEIAEDERHVVILSHRREAGPQAQVRTETIPEESGQDTGTVFFQVAHYSPIAPEELDFYLIEDGDELDGNTEPVATVNYDGLGEGEWSEVQEFEKGDFDLIVTESGADPTDADEQLFRHDLDQSEASLLEGEVIFFAAMDSRRASSPIDVTLVREAAGSPYLGMLDERAGLRILHGVLDHDDPGEDGSIDIDLDDQSELVTDLSPEDTSATQAIEHGERELTARYSSSQGDILTDEELEIQESEDVFAIVAGRASSDTFELIRRGMPFSPMNSEDGRFLFTHAAPDYPGELEVAFADDDEPLGEELEVGEGPIFNLPAEEFELEVRDEQEELVAEMDLAIEAGILYNITAVDNEDGEIELIVDELPVNPPLD